MSYTPEIIPVVSTANSSTATLTSGSVFTGTSEDLKDYSLITVTVISDVASATDGLSLQQSSNGTNWDLIDTYTIAAATAKTISLPRQARYFRLVYTNGGTGQASFRLQTIYTPISGKSSSQRPSDNYSNEFDGEQAVSYGMTFNGTTWDRAKGDIDLAVTGQGSQTALNQNIILATAGTGSYNTLDGVTGISFRSVSLQIIPAAGTVTAGVITFEGSNDNTNFVQVFLSDNANITAVPVATVTLVASTPRHFVGAIPFRYFRARISTGITGTTTGVQAHTVFSTVPFSSPRLTVSQATGASLNVAVSSAPSTAVTMAANATTTPAKAQDVASGANDTGIPPLLVRRDTPTALTPIAGDFAFPQVSANGEQWMRSTVEIADDAAVTLGTNRGNLIEGVAVQTDGTDPTAVSAEGDAAIFRTDMNRILLVNQTHPRGTTVSADYASAQTNTSVIAAPGASLSIYITDIQLSNGATAGNVTLLNGSAGTVLWEAYPAINGGAVLNLRQPIKLSANTALCITSTTVTTHSIFIGYYIAP